MPRTPGGDYTLPDGQPVEPNTVIESDVHNELASDLANEMADSLSRTGKGGMLVPFRLIDGSFDNPAFSFTSDFGTGMFFKPSSNELGFSADRVNSFTVTKEGVTVDGVTTTTRTLGTSQELASETSTEHAFQAGLDDNLNIKFGADGLQAMSNGVVSILHLNKDGGDLYINNVKYVPGGGGDGLYFVDGFTPVAGTEYPDTTDHTPGAFWIVENTGSYTFTGGDLSGQTADDGDTMIFGDEGWYLSASAIDPAAYVKKSGDTMTGDLSLVTDASGERAVKFNRQNGTIKGAIGNMDTTEEFEVALADTSGTSFIANIKLVPDGNVRADFASPANEKDLITKEYGDAHYLGGGSGDYLPLLGGTMLGDIFMEADATGKRFIAFTRNDQTMRSAIGSGGTTEDFEILLADAAGLNRIANLKLINDGNIRVDYTNPTHDNDLITKGYGDIHYSGGGGGGDFMSDGSVPMTGGITFEAGDDNWINFYDTVNSETRAGIDAATSLDSMYIFLHPVTGSGNSGCYLTLDRKGNLSSSTQNPTINQDFITKGYGDTHYLSGGGGGDFYSDGHVPMTGIFQMNAPATGVMFSRILRDDGTLKLAYGSRDTTNQFELLLANTAGDVEINKLILKENGNIAAPFATPAANEDLVTKAYGDANYGGGGGGGDFMADGSVPMTGDFQGGNHKLTGIADGVAADDAATMSQLAASGGGDFMANGTIPMTGTMTFNAPASGVIFTRIMRSDGTFKLAYGSRDTANQFELLLANAAGDAEINKLLLKEDGNIEAPFASPAADGDLVTKEYGDANYLGGAGGGDFYADGHVPMTGDMLMDADATGSRAIQIRRDDGTLKCAIGSWNDTEEMELALLNTAGDTGISRLLLRTNGNVAAPAGATPSADTDLVTKAYGDAHYLGGTGGGDFMADGSVPMTGDFQGGGNKLTGIADGTADTDAATVGQLPPAGGGAETVHDMGSATEVNATNGTMLIKTPSGTEALTANLSTGESVTLIVKNADGTNNLTISGVTWIGSIPTEWTGKDVFILWNDGAETYISYTGGAA